jgi:hypothetical protein
MAAIFFLSKMRQHWKSNTYIHLKVCDMYFLMLPPDGVWVQRSGIDHAPNVSLLLTAVRNGSN